MEKQAAKRSHSDSQDVLEGVRAVLLDIEGTTTPITFVKNKLCGYVRENLKTYLENHWDNEECQADVTALRKQVTVDQEAKVDGVIAIPDASEDNRDAVIEAIVKNVEWQMDTDRKTTGVGALQGHMWREAYKTGKVQGELFEDVVEGLKSWTSEGKKVYIFSAGSVEAQKLMFGYTEKGDLTEHVTGYFDTTTGSKVEKDTYTAIVKETGVAAEELAFFTDLPAEASAAAEAGMKTCLVTREGNAPLSDDDKKKYNTIASFAELSSEAPAAKKLENEEGNGAAEEDVDSAEEEDAEEEEVDGEDGVEGVDNGDS